MTFSRTGDFHVGTFHERPNRFVILVHYEQELVRCHLPNPGRMVELLFEQETRLIFTKAPANSSRKTDGTVIGILFDDNTVVNLDTMLFAKLLPDAIKHNAIPEFKRWKMLDSERTIGAHRFDFVLEVDGQTVITEVKSTTRVIDGVACFPDAVSVRATNHLEALEKLQEQGRKCLVLFTVYRLADRFQPCRRIDPIFADTFDRVSKVVDVMALQIYGRWVNHNCIAYEITGLLPVG